MDNRGQTAVEAAITLGFLFLFLVCVYHSFRIAVDKVRSLETLDHQARSHQVGLSFRSLHLPQVNTLPYSGTGPLIDQIALHFHAYRSPLLWTSTLRVAMPNPTFLDRSWPGARPERRSER